MNATFRRSSLWCILGVLVASHLWAPSFDAPAIAVPAVAVPTLAQAADDQAAPNTTPAKDASAKDAPAKDSQGKDAGDATPPRSDGAVPVVGGGPVIIIPIEGMIYDFTFESLKRRVKRAEDLKASHIVFEINTNGGVLTDTLDIAKFIKGIQIETTAWINPKAYSAGVIIASSCKSIIMAPSASTGDAAPINSTGESMAPTERAKVLSPLLNELKDNAYNTKYPYAVLHAMCVLGVEVYEVKHKDSGEIKYVNQIDKQIMVDGAKRSSLKDKVQDVFGIEGDDAVGSATQRDATDADRERWTLVRQVHDGKTLLTLNQVEASSIGFAEPGTFRTDDDVLAYAQGSEIVRINESWSEGLAGWLTSPPVRGVLMIIFAVAMLIEFLTPGLGIPGATAGIVLLILIASPFVIGLAEIWHLILIFIGFMLMVAEVFFIPGFGVAGISGIICLLAGLVLAVVPTTGKGPMPLPAPEMMQTLQMSMLWMFVAVIGTGVAFYFLTKHYGQLPFFNKLTLNASQATVTLASPGQTQRMEDPEVMEARKRIAGDEVLGDETIAIGAEGITSMQLRPLGRAEFAGKVIDVESVSTWVEPGRKVRIIEKIGNRIIVEEV